MRKKLALSRETLRRLATCGPAAAVTGGTESCNETLCSTESGCHPAKPETGR
jgi:hypothetical protein